MVNGANKQSGGSVENHSPYKESPKESPQKESSEKESPRKESESGDIDKQHGSSSGESPVSQLPDNKLTSATDLSQIYNINSDTAKLATAAKAQQGGKTYHGNNLNLSDLLNEVNKLKSSKDKLSNGLSNRSSNRSDKPSKSNSTSELSGSVAESLSDILSIHNKIDFSTESDNSFQTDGDGTSSQIKYLTSSNAHGSTSIENIYTID